MYCLYTYARKRCACGAVLFYAQLVFKLKSDTIRVHRHMNYTHTHAVCSTLGRNVALLGPFIPVYRIHWKTFHCLTRFRLSYHNNNYGRCAAVAINKREIPNPIAKICAIHRYKFICKSSSFKAASSFFVIYFMMEFNVIFEHCQVPIIGSSSSHQTRAMNCVSRKTVFLKFFCLLRNNDDT